MRYSLITYIKVLLVLVLFLNFSCSNREERGTEKSIKKEQQSHNSSKKISKVSEAPEVRVYFEQSGSMRGYVGQGASDFKNSLFNVIGELKREFNNNIKLYFVTNSKIKSIERDVIEFCETIDINTFKAGSSKMEDMLSSIIDSTNSNVLSVFVSDAIFSLGDGDDALNGLAQVKGKVKDRVYAKIDENEKKNLDFGIRMYQMMSEFSGTYYDRTDSKTELSKVKRPLYFMAMGTTDLLEKVRNNEHLIFRKSDGFKQSIELNSKDYSSSYSFDENSIYVSLLGSTFKKGVYKSSKVKDRIIGIEGLKPSRGKNGLSFQVAIAMDLSNLPVSEEYKLNKGNYQINKKDGYSIKEIKKINDVELKPSDNKFLKKKDGTMKATHVLIVSSNEVAFPSIKLEMVRKTPDNFKASYGGVEEDDNISVNLDKTFGLQYLVEGFDQAFSRKFQEGGGQNLYFSLTVPIKAESTSAGSWILWLVVLLVTGFIVFVYLKNRKR